MRNFLNKLYKFSTSWTGTIIIVLLFVFFIAQSFVIPSGSMKRTLLIGDFLFAKKFSYGISTPEIPIIGLKIFPDINGNGHLIEGERPKRGDIVIFYVPTNKRDHFVKRCVAVGEDEIIYYDKHLLIHFHEGDEYIKKNYPKDKIVEVMGKLWVDNPYMDKFPGIQYLPEYNANSFLLMLFRSDEVDMRPIYIRGLKGAKVFGNGSSPINAFYKKVEKDNFYMIGDNRDNSEDSRFWGSVPYSLIIGKPWFIYFSLEYRSYERVAKGIGGGRDHYMLKKVCQDSPLLSKECEEKWNRYRFTIRWDRIFQDIDEFQYKEPLR
jgi:signal peptidase I